MAQQVGAVVFKIDADLKNVQSQLRTLEGNFQSSFAKIEGLGKNVLGSLGLGLSIGSIVSFGKEILNFAGNLQDLSNQTQISVRTLSGIKSVLEENGTSLDAFARGIFNAQKNLGGIDQDSDAAAQAVKTLGLNLNELRNGSTDLFLDRVTNALAKVENPTQRAALAAQLLGKSAKEIVPALIEMSGKLEDLRSKGLSPDLVKSLDDAGDAITKLHNKILAVGAVTYAGWLHQLGLVTVEGKQLRDELKTTASEIENIDRILRSKKGTFGFLFRHDEGQLLEQRGRATERLIDLNDKLIRLERGPEKPTTPFKPSAKAGAGTKDTGVQDFFAGLQKQIDTIDLEFTKLRDGDQIAKEIALDLQFADFNLKRVAEGKPIASIEEFRKYKEIIVEATAKLEKFKAEQELVDLTQSLKLGAIDTTTAEGAQRKQIAQIEVEFAKTAKKISELGKTAGLTQEDIAEKVGLAWSNAINQINLSRDQAQKQLDDLRQSLQLGAIDVRTPEGAERKRIAGIEVEFAKTAAKIDELGRAAGMSQEQIAEDVELAWKKALNEINTTTDEITEFQRRAMERAFDAGADLLKGALGGQIKSWEDFGSRVKKVIDEIVADWLTLQLKIAILGPDFGKSGGQVGGLVGSLGSGISNFFSGFKFPTFHEGGVVGSTYTFAHKPVEQRIFAQAPRFHSGWSGGMPGLAPDEVPAILQKGEIVLPRGTQMGDARRNQVTVVHIHQPNFTDRRSMQQIQSRLGQTVKAANRNL